MANRPVFAVKMSAPYYTAVDVEFNYAGGFSLSQMRKNISSIHGIYTRRFPDERVLEISSKSEKEEGVRLSAFNLTKYVPSIGRAIPVERIFQGGKKFRYGGPFTDLYEVSSRDAKGDDRLTSSGELVAFCFEGQEYPLNPKTAFYDWIYINALLENEELANTLLQYDAFTDIVFNPNKSVNCQAKAAAVFVSLGRLGLLDKVKDFEDFLGLYNLKLHTVSAPEEQPPKEPEKPQITVSVGDIVIHKVWGEGRVTASGNGVLTISFATVGEKKLGEKWVMESCEIVTE